MFVLQVTDWGMGINKAFGREYYRPGEIMQIVLLIGLELVWIERSTSAGIWYRVAFGPSPFFTQQVTEHEVIAQIVQHFTCFELLEVSPC